MVYYMKIDLGLSFSSWIRPRKGRTALGPSLLGRGCYSFPICYPLVQCLSLTMCDLKLCPY